MRDPAHFSNDVWRERMMERWSEYPHRQPDVKMSAGLRLWLPVVLSLLVQVPPTFISWSGDRSVGFVAAHPGPLAIVLALIGPVALIFARRFPGPVVAVVAAAAAADLIFGSSATPPYVALAFAVVGALVRGARGWAWASVGLAWILTVAIGIAIGSGNAWTPVRIAGTTLGILVVFGIGESMRTRREHYEQFRRASAQRKQTEVQAERVRIARELHDVLAHSLSQINVQASVGLHLMQKQPDKAADALASIKETSKTALDEVRSVLGILRAEDGQDPSVPLVPEPDLSRLAGLAASVTSQGVEVSLDNRVEAAPKPVQLAIYRIVQESLTNVVRHAHAKSAAVNIREHEKSYVVTIADDGTGHDGTPDLGRGLMGMRERAELLGGTFETGRSHSGGMLITARIPMKETAA